MEKINNDSKGIIQKEVEQNNKKIGELNHKIGVLTENNFETKMLFIAMFGMIPWVLLTINIEWISSFFSLKGTLLTYMPALISGVVGISAQTIFSKVTKAKQKLEQFSSSKTQKDRNEEQLRYEVEKETLETKNKVLTQILKRIDSRTFYHKKENDRLRIIIQKHILKRNFEHIRNKKQALGDKCKFLGFGMSATTIFFCFPSAGIFTIENPLLFFLIGGVSFGTYRVIKDHQDKELFEKMNAELGKQSLTEEMDIYETEILQEELQREMTELRMEQITLTPFSLENKKVEEKDNLLLSDNEETKDLSQKKYRKILKK